MTQNVNELCDVIVCLESLEEFIESIEVRQFTFIAEREAGWRDYYYFPISTSVERGFPEPIILGASE